MYTMNDKNQTDNELTILRTRNSVEIEIDPDTVLSCPFEDTENIPEERAYNKSAPHNNEADIDDEGLTSSKSVRGMAHQPPHQNRHQTQRQPTFRLPRKEWVTESSSNLHQQFGPYPLR